jgi:hypothetical protein
MTPFNPAVVDEWENAISFGFPPARFSLSFWLEWSVSTGFSRFRGLSDSDPPSIGGPSTGILGTTGSTHTGGHLNTANELEELLNRALGNYFGKKVHRKRTIRRAFEKLHQRIDSCLSIEELAVIAHLNNKALNWMDPNSKHYNMAWQLYLDINKDLKKARQRITLELRR